ncbi:hypothetical protein [Psychroserpens sp.]|uniref:hypothetical protein n=1 Tax=Psychroserpens sp. TaxID=2020870 RepID=UPI002B265E78|nr:hypothetical protein [Psychroserpens sp.]
MNTKTFLVSGLIGGIVDWLLGWLFYGILLADYFPQPAESTKTMVCILAGCLTFGFFVSYIFNRWAQISTAATGAKAGAIIGFFMGLNASLFNMALVKGVTYQMFAIDLVVSIILAAIVGAVVGIVNGKLNPNN